MRKILGALCALPLAAALFATPAAADLLVQEGTVSASGGVATIDIGQFNGIEGRYRVNVVTSDGVITLADISRLVGIGEYDPADGFIGYDEEEAGCVAAPTCIGYHRGAPASAGYIVGPELFEFFSTRNLTPPPGVAFYDHLSGEVQIAGTGQIAYRVDISPVPEPATWALLIAGLALAGAALRRRPALA